MLKVLSVAYYIGMILIVAGILFELNDLPYAFMCLVAGLVPFLAARLYNFTKGKPENKRLHGILVVSALFLVVTAALIIMHRNYWIITVLTTAALDLYVSLRKFTR